METAHFLRLFFVLAACFFALFLALYFTLREQVQRWFPSESPPAMLTNAVASIHAIVVVIPSAYLVLSGRYNDDPEFACPLGRLVCCVTAGYMLYDTALLLLFKATGHSQKRNASSSPMMLLVFACHHSLSLGSIWFCLKYDYGLNLVLVGLLFEVSTPLFHAVQFLQCSGIDKLFPTTFRAASLIALASFAFARFPASVYQVIQVHR
eukprot:TRINITY_DN4839_c0_g1_i3.p1 TRINITY_DN4839_c0_g1~~TRINITY_DN4839_c0_g1_i3.p1  ORF type:complete len:208 (+),score=19.29 TRINITY_DN4839_c0_g1_i3:146-769(+)